MIDEIIKYENLSEDLEGLVKKLSLPEPKRVLSNYKESVVRKGKPYQIFYTDKTKELVDKHFDFYIEKFNYQF